MASDWQRKTILTRDGKQSDMTDWLRKTILTRDGKQSDMTDK